MLEIYKSMLQSTFWAPIRLNSFILVNIFLRVTTLSFPYVFTYIIMNYNLNNNN